MTKMLLLLVAVLAFFWLLRRALSSRGTRSTRGRGDGPGDKAAPAQPPPELVACAHCGVHLPQNEAFASDVGAPGAKRFFCTEEHLKLGPH